MKQLRWKDFSLVSKIVIEVGMIAVLLFAMNMLFYVRINNSMQKMDNVYASNAELTELSQGPNDTIKRYSKSPCVTWCNAASSPSRKARISSE